MDNSSELFSPASKTHQSSFGLLDDKAIQDLSLENLHRVRDKPPIPAKQTIQMTNKNKLNKQSTNEDELNYILSNAENAEQTVESIRLNESDLKELEDEFTFDDEDDQDEIDLLTKINQNKLNSLKDEDNNLTYKYSISKNKSNDSSKFGNSFKNELTSVSPDHFDYDLDKSCNFTAVEFKLPDRQTTQLSNELLMDESSNILRNSSNDLDITTNRSSQSFKINYDKMDEINENLNAKPEPIQTNDSLSLSKTDFDNQTKPECKLEFDEAETTINYKNNSVSEQTPKLNKTTDNSISAKSTKFNLTGIDDEASGNFSKQEKSTLNFTELNQSLNNTVNNLSSVDRINQLVQQSVERVKRIGQTHLTNSNEDYLSLIKQNPKNNFLNDSTKQQQLQQQQQHQAFNRFSTSTVRTTNTNYKAELENTSNQNLTQFDNTLLTTPSKTFNQSMDKNSELPSIYFKPDSDAALANNHMFDNPFDSVAFNQTNKIELNNENDMFEFKQADDFIEDLKKDEVINRKEFADNELSVCMNYDKTNLSLNQTNTNSNSSGSSNGSVSNEKWWKNLNIQQTSKLELSNLSNVSSMNLNETKSKQEQQKQKVPVEAYFNRKSEMPTYLAEKESDVRLSEYEPNIKSNLNDQTILAENNKENNLCKKIPEEEDITFSSNNQGSSLSSSNFSFTLNSSDTGEFIQKKSTNKSSTTTPFQLSKALASLGNKQTESIQKDGKKALKEINEELERVSNRLAETKNGTKISEPLMSSSIKLSNTNSNLKALIQMDETISSINSSDLTTHMKTKTESKDSKSAQNNQTSKSNKASGSLTSTPSKLTKSISESSNLNSISYKTNQSNNESNSNNPFNQDSFISSIPERANDSTLVVNHRHHQQQKHKSSSSSSSSSTQSHKLKKQKNAEIQTSPNQTTTTDAQMKKILLKSNSQEDNRASISNISSASSNSSTDTTNNPSQTITSQFNVINNLAAAINNNTAPNGLVPVAFIPINSFFPCVQKFYDDMQTTANNTNTNKSSSINKSNFESNNLSTNSLNLNNKLFVDTYSNYNSSSSLPSVCSNQSQSFQNASKFELPQFEFDKNSIDFGQVAEGCSQTLRIHAKLLNSGSILKQGYLQLELGECLEWSIDAYDSTNETKLKSDEQINSQRLNLIKKKYNEFSLKSKFRKTLTLHADKSTIDTDSNSTKLHFDLVSNFYEFFIHLNLNELNFFKELIQNLDSVSLEQLEPLLVRTSLYMYYYIPLTSTSNNQLIDSTGSSLCSSQTKKYLLNRIDLRFILGYARLRTNASIDSIEFEIAEDLDSSQTNHSKTIDSNDEIDRTLTSINELAIDKKPITLEQLIPLSNAGNIDIEVDCYLSFEQQEQLQAIKFNSYEIKLDDSVLLLHSKSKHKQYARILLNKTQTCVSNDPNLNKLKFTVEVKPNGFKYEIPVKIKFVSNKSKSQPSKQLVSSASSSSLSKNVKLSSSRSVLYFGKSLNSYKKWDSEVLNPGLMDEFTIMNSNSFRIKCQITVSCLNEFASNCFKFSSEMKNNSNSSIQLNELMTQMSLSLEPSESLRLKIKFYPPSQYDPNNSIITGLAKMSVHGFNHKFNVQLFGFMSESNLEIENGTKVNDLIESDSLNLQLNHRNIKQFKYSIELLQARTTTSNKNIYRKVLKIKNKSSNSKCVLYPCLFSKSLSKEINITTTRINKSNELCFDLGIDSSGFLNRLRFLFNKESCLNSTSDLNWLEIKPDEQDMLNFEIISIKADPKQQKSDFINIEDVYICLFWIEYDINSYITQYVQNTNTNPTKSANSFIDLFINKLLSNNSFFTNQNGLSMSSLNINESSTKLNRLSSVSSASLADNSCLSTNGSIIGLQSKSKLTRDDFVRLLRQSIKCSYLSLTTQSFEFENDSFEFNESKKEHVIDTKKSDLLQISLNKLENDSNSQLIISSNEPLNESWSVNTNTIFIENIKNEKLLEQCSAKIYLKNNLSRKQLTFDIKYKTNYLSVLPNSGILEPLTSLEIVIKPRKDVYTVLPWFGLISIWCNKIQKDVRVSLYSNLSTSTSGSLEIPRTLQMSQNLKNNLSNSYLNTLAPSLANSSTPYNSNNSNSIEQGTIISEISQYTLDSLSLTPLISASFLMPPPSSSFSTSLNQQNSKTNISKSFKNDSNLNCTSGDDSITKIVRSGNDAQVRFPPVCVTQRKSVELTLTNPTNTYVNWKAFSTVPAFVRLKEDENSIVKSSYSVFLITPNSGTIPANQTQKIKIEFCPREVYGLFNQYWEIDTRTDFQDISSNTLNNTNNKKSDPNLPSSYTCRLILTGKSVPLIENQKLMEQKLAQEEDYNSRLTNRILKSKTNTFNNSNNNDDLDNTNRAFNKSSEISKSGFNNRTKENISNGSTSSDKTLSYLSSQKSNSSLASSLLSSTSASTNTTSLNNSNKNRIIIKDEIIKFPDTAVNQSSKSFLTIHNREDCERKLSIFSLIEPFYCKHSELTISSKHYIKIPIDFKPKTAGDYTEKILIRVEKYDTPLSCLIKAKCIPN